MWSDFTLQVLRVIIFLLEDCDAFPLFQKTAADAAKSLKDKQLAEDPFLK